MIKKLLIAFLIFNSSFLITHAQTPKSYTSAEILLQLKKLNVLGSVLYIAAHPDDENTRLLAYKEKEKCLIQAGFDVLVFVPSYDEDLGRITCGNAILSGSKPEIPYKENIFKLN